MSVPLWIVESAEQFWNLAGMSHQSYPRDLEEAITNSFQLTIQSVEGLRISKVQNWFSNQRITIPLNMPDRSLRGCLITHGEVGFVFLEANDSEAEKRFTLAHELAHFLRDHQYHRNRVMKTLGSRGIEIYDGNRVPESSDHLEAILRGVTLQAFIHLMNRDSAFQDEVHASETEADRLALEILAPERMVRERVSLGSLESLSRVLVDEFGLPSGVASEYAKTFFDLSDSPLLLRIIGLLGQSNKL
jgi:Zn-dependent peptidase ImmA (M78 family)